MIKEPEKLKVKGYLIEVKWGGKVLDSIWVKDEKSLEEEKTGLILANPECEIEILEIIG